MGNLQFTALQYNAASPDSYRGDSTTRPPAALVRYLSVATASAVLLLILSSSSVSAQSLDSLRTLLRENNPELRALAYDYRAALSISPQLRQLPDLEIGGGVSILPVETRLGPQRARVMVTQMLPWPGTLAAMSALADARAQPILEQAAAMQLDLLFQLESNYYQLVAAENKIVALDTSLTLYASLRSIALSRIENGRGSSVDVYRLELRTNATRRQIEELRAEQALAWSDIEQLVNQELPRIVVLPTDSPDRVLPTEPRFDDHPLVRIFALQEFVSRRTISLSYMEARPGIAVGVDYIATGKRTDAEPPGNGRDAILPRVMVRFPLSGGKYRAKRDEESLRIQAIAARRTSVTTQLTTALEKAAIARQDAADRLRYLDEQRTTISAALTIARAEYANSRRPFDELLQLQNEYVDLLIQSIEAQRTLFTQAAVIDRYLPRR
ncbi:outer membrane protein TolC [Lewinella aquimaris]|uniref:Outer membrane protein TolC n=1 Tax=Neolewinella aquimaris TaxID=1835722 RepID=A0A840E2G0_9BACT|nr:TolC family protein [Neolewinella aquimaris]MBB4079401.1 outer membrane protein TolC [Neolewinella aquimaris]